MQKLVPALILAAVSAFAINVQAASHAGAAPMKADDGTTKASEPAAAASSAHKKKSSKNKSQHAKTEKKTQEKK